MKRLHKIIFVFVLGLFTAITLTACGANNIVSGRIKSGTMETEVVLNGTLDTSRAVVIYTYSNDKEVEVKAKDLSFSTLNTTTIGTKQLTITYKKFSFKVNIEVVEAEVEEADMLSVTSFSSDLLIDFSENKKIQSNKENEFYDLSAPLYVGDDNAFNLKLKINGINILTGELETDAQRVRTTISAWLKDTNGDYQVLEDEALEALVAINDEYTTFDFTTTAVGKTFKFQVEPTNVADDYEINPIVFEVVVVDGFNVYTAKELSVYDNVNEEGKWDAIKGEALTGINVNAVVLQADIAITKADTPASIYWTTSDAKYNTLKGTTTETLDGSLKDLNGTGIYKRVITHGDEFTFHGNYFAVDASALPKIVIDANDKAVNYDPLAPEEGEGITIHNALFYTYTADANESAPTKVKWNNISFIGNSALNNDVRNSGGILLMKNHKVDFHAYNTLHRNFTVGYFMELGNAANNNLGNYLIEKSKGYGSYTALFYIWGAENMTILNSEFKRSGGPAMIVDDVQHETTKESLYPTHLNIVASNIESLVSGSEPWFTSYEGSGAIVGGLASADVFYGTHPLLGSNPMGLPTNKTIIGGTVVASGETYYQLNIIAAMKSSVAEGITAERVRGWIKIYDTVEAFGNPNSVYGLDMDTINHLDGVNLADKAMDTGNHYLQSSGNGGYIAPVETGTPDTTYYMGNGLPYNVGTYVNVYTSMGIGAIVKLYDRV